MDASYYGAVPVAQPTGGPGPQPSPENTAPLRTAQVSGKAGLFEQAGFWIVAIIAVAMGLVHLSIRWS